MELGKALGRRKNKTDLDVLLGRAFQDIFIVECDIYVYLVKTDTLKTTE